MYYERLEACDAHNEEVLKDGYQHCVRWLGDREEICTWRKGLGPFRNGFQYRVHLGRVFEAREGCWSNALEMVETGDVVGGE